MSKSAGQDKLPTEEQLKNYLQRAPDMGEAGGLFHGRQEWAAVVDRTGEVRAVASATDDMGKIWPGSQAVAEAKAFTANAFSTDDAPLSTARLYTLTQPGHSLWGISGAAPYDPGCLGTKHPAGKTCGGAISFGGGVPLYADGKIIGGLGVSGDTPCADHEIAKRLRDLAGLNPPGGMEADDITYSSVDGASVYTHPLCPNTWRNGKKIGDEPAAEGY